MNALYVTVLTKKALGELNDKLCALDMNANKYRKSTSQSTFVVFINCLTAVSTLGDPGKSE